MNPVIRCACFLAFWSVVATPHAQSVPEVFTLFDRERVFQTDGSRGPFAISDWAIEKASVRVWADGVLLLRDRVAYFSRRIPRATSRCRAWFPGPLCERGTKNRN